MAKKQINENYIHNCGTKKVDIVNYEKAIIDMGYDDEQIKEILDFYLFHAPVIKSDSNENVRFGLKSLGDYGWKGTPYLNKLEGRLLKAANLGMFCIIRADSIKQTLESMELGTRICCEHPRAVLKQLFTVDVMEDGTVNFANKETRMICLFRHIRNSIAHNCTYLFDNGNIMLEDADDKKSITARVLIPKQALLEWIHIVKHGIE